MRHSAVVPSRVLVAGVVVSDTGFAREWGKNPAKAYFATVTAELDRAGPNVNLWDTPMPPPIVNALMADTRLSPVLRMAGIPFQLQAPSSEPLLVDDTGHLRPVAARGLVAQRADVKEPTPSATCCCTAPSRSTVPLAPTQTEVATADWFVKAAYFSNRENQVPSNSWTPTATSRRCRRPTWPAGAGHHVLRPVAAGSPPRSSGYAPPIPRRTCACENLEIGLPR